MAWIFLKKEHVLSRLAADELACIEDTGGGETERLEGILYQVTALVRSHVNSCHKNTMGEANTIPEECLHAAATLAKHDLRATLPSTGQDEESSLRSDEYRNAMSFLRDVAQCKVVISGSSPQSGSLVTGCFGGDPYHRF